MEEAADHQTVASATREDVGLARRFAGKNLLVTGSSGFLASALIARLSDVDCRICCASRSNAPFPSMRGASAALERVTGDIRERRFWTQALPDMHFVFHFAAQTSVYTADQNTADDWAANVLPMVRLLETCQEHGWRPGILFAGSVTQGGLPVTLPVDEAHPDRPVTIYDFHKLLAEWYLEHYVRTGRARGTTLRLANLYGPGPASSRPDRGILNQMMHRAWRGEWLPLYGDGTQLRDYLFISDAVDAFLLAAVHLDTIDGEHFVLGSGQGHTLAQAFKLVADRVAAATGRQVPIHHIEPPRALSEIEARDFVADVSRFRSATGWMPRVTLAQGIDLTLESFGGEHGPAS